MTLLPLAGWASDITVTLGTINKTYGEDDPVFTVDNFSIKLSDDPDWGTDVPTKDLLKGFFSYRRVEEGNDVGGTYTYTLIVSGSLATEHPKWNIVISNPGYVNVFAKDVSTLEVVDQYFNVGSWNTPSLINPANGEVLGADDIESIDYKTSEGGEITGVGTDNKVIVTGKGNYTGTATLTFNITGKPLDNESIVAAFNEEPALTYTGSAQDVPAFTVKDGETALVLDTDFEVTDPADVTNAGEKTITITAKAGSNYSGSTTLPYTIAKKSLGDVANDIIGEGITTSFYKDINYKVYTGTKVSWGGNTTSVKWNGKSLDRDIDYTRSTKGDFINVTTGLDDADKPYYLFTGKGNFEGTVKMPINITPRDLSEVTISTDLEADQTYTGEQIKPSTEGKITYSTLPALVEGTDYEVEYGENRNVADGGTITIQGIGNYGGEAIVKNFNITNATLYVDATEYTANIGTTPALADNYEFRWLGSDKDTKPTVTGTPVVELESGFTTDNAGDFENAIKVASVEGVTVPNYTVAIGNKATLHVAKSDFTIAFKENLGITYGDDVPDFSANYSDYVTVSKSAAVSAVTIKLYNGEEEVTAGTTMLPVKEGGYTLKVENVTLDGANYTEPELPANTVFTVNPKEIKIVAKPQELDFDNPEPELESEANTYIEIQDASGVTIGKTAFTALYGVWKSDFVESRTWEEHDGTVANSGYIRVNLKAGYDNVNFNVTTVNGEVTYKGIPAELVFDKEVDDVFDKIKTYDGITKNVKVILYRKNELANGKTYSWNQQDWNTMILPFEVTVREISNAIGYAIVNVFNEDNTTPSNADFKLTMGTIPANTPFLLKTDESIEDGFELKFVDKTIVAPEESTVTLTSENGISYIGTYEDVEINKVTSKGQDPANPTYWNYYADNVIRGIGATSENVYTVYPFAAFFNWTAPSAGVRNMTITVEDVDGSVTAISSIDAESNDTTAEGLYNLNGVKMDGAPTQKGIYIKNGKKVVIK